MVFVCAAIFGVLVSSVVLILQMTGHDTGRLPYVSLGISVAILLSIGFSLLRPRNALTAEDIDRMLRGVREIQVRRGHRKPE